jgi:peroxiredoxin
VSLSEDHLAENFRIGANKGKTMQLSRLGSHPIAAYFDARYNTRGCMIEAIDITRLSAGVAKARAKVVGISIDSVTRAQVGHTKTVLETVRTL